LLLAAGELSRVLAGLVGDLDALEVLHRNRLGLGFGHLANPDRREGAVFHHRQVREEVEVLEHHADFTADLLDVLEVVGQRGAVSYS